MLKPGLVKENPAAFVPDYARVALGESFALFDPASTVAYTHGPMGSYHHGVELAIPNQSTLAVKIIGRRDFDETKAMGRSVIRQGAEQDVFPRLKDCRVELGVFVVTSAKNYTAWQDAARRSPKVHKLLESIRFRVDLGNELGVRESHLGADIVETLTGGPAHTFRRVGGLFYPIDIDTPKPAKIAPEGSELLLDPEAKRRRRKQQITGSFVLAADQPK